MFNLILPLVICFSPVEIFNRDPYKMENVVSRKVRGMSRCILTAADLTGDGNDNVIRLINEESRRFISIGDIYGKTLMQVNFRGSLRYQHLIMYPGDSLFDYNGDGVKDFTIGSKRNDTLFLNIISPLWEGKQIPLYDSASFEHNWVRWNTFIHRNLYKLNDSLLLFFAGTNYDCKPRGIYCLNYKTGDIKWKFLYPGTTPTFRVIEEGILILTRSPSNSCKVRDETDFYGWMYFMDFRGNLLWKKNLGDGIDAMLLSITGDSVFIYATRTALNRAGEGYIGIFSLEERKFIKRREFHGMAKSTYTSSAGNSNQKNKIRFLAERNRIFTLNHNLDVVNDFKIDSAYKYYCLKDFPREGKITHVATTKGPSGLFYSEGGELLCKVDDVRSVMDVNYGDADNYVLLRGVELEQICRFVPNRLNLTEILILFAIPAGLFAIAYLLYRIILYLRIHNSLKNEISSYIFIVNSRGNLLSSSPGLKENLGIDMKNKQKVIKQLEDSKFSDLFDFVVTTLKNDKGMEDRLYFRKEAEEYYFTIRSTTVKIFGKTLVYIFCLNDISETIRSEKYESLFAFSRIITHDIKNPLSSLMMLQDRIKSSGNPEDVREYSEKAKDEIRQMKKLTNSILKLSSEQLQIKNPLEINEVIKNSVDLNFKGFEERIIMDLVEEGIVIRGDRDLLRMAFSNVIQNSLEASSGSEKVKIKTEVRNSKGIIIFEDRGEGMDEETLKNAMNPYYTSKSGGSGLGLYITWEVVKKHDGSVIIDSSPGHGTTVKIIFSI